MTKGDKKPDTPTDITTGMTVKKLTPQQAASRAKVSRGTIMNAIKDGNLIAMRDNRNRWQITTDNLSKWLSNRGDTISDTTTDSSVNINTPKADENAIRVAVLEAELKARDQRITDLESDRDSWKEQAQALARRPRRWWPF